ncbi:hypothetical protein ACKTEK_07985 [Tepidamorphus sp. 3E244]|uniref:hypothetical protein n=1 Tax=Tepidamorphus sp. 3E244 TaxID=3385498 RepID=UPI0038FC2182
MKYLAALSLLVGLLSAIDVVAFNGDIARDLLRDAKYQGNKFSGSVRRYTKQIEVSHAG